MLVGRDLGLPYLVVLVVVVIGFVIRRKWRNAADRREEIKRLLVLASEEAARVELEATEEYYYSSITTSSVPASSWVPAPVPASASVPLASPLKQPPYQCAVCFSPTSTRCAKCKAVRYCSGRCQIVHWRQGHKDECRPFVAVNPIKDASNSPSRQEDGKDSNANLSAENTHEVLHHKNAVEVQSRAHRPETNPIFQSSSDSSVEASSSGSGDSDGMDACQYADNFATVKSERQTLLSPARKSTSSGKINQNKSNLSDEDTRSGFSSASSRTDGSTESSFSEPLTSSSGFWTGTIHSKKSTLDEVDGFELSSSSSTGTANENMVDSQSVFGLSSNVTKNGNNIEIDTTIIQDKSSPTGPESKKSNDKTTSSEEMFIDGLKSRHPPRCSSETSSLPIKDSKPFGGIPSARTEQSKRVFNNKSVASPAFESTGVVSSLLKASDARLTSSTSRSTSQTTNSIKVDDENHRVVTRSSKPIENSQSARNGLKTSMLKVVDQLKPSKLSRHCSPRGESETAHRYSCKGLFSYEMFVKLYTLKKVELQPFGLINCGNSCYANAVLQCLAYTPPLNAYLLEGLHSKACNKREWCFTCEFEGLVLKAKDGNSPLSPIRILSQIESIGSNLGHGREEDAHEFLRYAIDTLQSVCLKEAGTNASNSLEEETTLIGLTFGGYLRSKIKCMKCGGKSERHERMMDLTVEIEGDIATLEEALNKFTCTEILDGENKYKCSRCKSYEKAKKKLTLLEAPNVLTIALKRFQSGKFGKLNKPIHFPEILDMAPYVSGTSDKSPVYRLYGVVVHVDIMNAAFSGHYVCYVKNVQNRWFKIDDSRVKEVDLHSVLTKGAYMLLYARCSPRAPRLIRSLLMRHHHDPRKHKPTTPFPSSEPWDHPPVRHRTLEEESSSSSDNSGFFSESCSCSTESSTHVEDRLSWDFEHDNANSNSSDSDTSSSSSFPSPPLYSMHSRLYPSGVLYGEEDDKRRNLSSSGSSRETNVDRLGGRPVNGLESSKPTLRRSTVRARSEF